MKANELRLGNVIYENTIDLENGNRFDKVITVDPGVITQCWMGVNLFKPIPLTPEILEKAGFKKMRRTFGDGHYFNYGANPVTSDYMIDLCWHTSTEYPFYLNAHHKIMYVHQLQNLFFALTGTELNIEL